MITGIFRSTTLTFLIFSFIHCILSDILFSARPYISNLNSNFFLRVKFNLNLLLFIYKRFFCIFFLRFPKVFCNIIFHLFQSFWMWLTKISSSFVSFDNFISIKIIFFHFPFGICRNVCWFCCTWLLWLIRISSSLSSCRTISLFITHRSSLGRWYAFRSWFLARLPSTWFTIILTTNLNPTFYFASRLSSTTWFTKPSTKTFFAYIIFIIFNTFHGLFANSCEINVFSFFLTILFLHTLLHIRLVILFLQQSILSLLSWTHCCFFDTFSFVHSISDCPVIWNS